MPDELAPTTPQQRKPTPRAERFEPGAILGDRYRIIAALGKGGMGEVYRADDLTLGQPVALKFLPEHFAADPIRLDRFRKEVAAARRVSHPHVCRVYDIGGCDGESFLSMEFVDGEDLGSLLRRVGRLSEEKGIEIGRQLCSALAAVHEQGLLHRDLKPANVMLDGRGKVRLTDFGLAAAAADLSASDVRSGTPLYMAPEQAGGKEVTVRSDLYALGLVLYELFTGQRAFADGKRDTSPPKPSSFISWQNPAVERVIQKCLEPDPANRPRSANEVLLALPGGDPLAAALAAGDTPSPQVVAAATVASSLRTSTGLLMVASILVLSLAAVLLQVPTSFAGRQAPDRSPREMAALARDVIRGFGYTERPFDTASGYAEDSRYIKQLQRHGMEGLASGQPPVVYFWYRQSPARIVNAAHPLNFGLEESPGQVTATRPALEVTGEILLCMDVQGRLIEFHAIPPAAGSTGASAPGWEKSIWDAAKLTESDFEPAASDMRPASFTDARLAWRARPDSSGAIAHLEAAACDGRIVYLHAAAEGVGDLRREASADLSSSTRWENLTVAVMFVLIGTLGSWLAWRNVRAGRANVPGAVRLGLVFAATILLLAIMTAKHSWDPNIELTSIVTATVGRMAIGGGLLIVAYLAVEPAVRRRWPWRLVGWNRLLEGRWRDPLVGRDILIGMLGGAILTVAFQLGQWAPTLLGWPAEPRSFPAIVYEAGPLLVPIVCFTILLYALTDFFVLFLLDRLVHREWLAVLLLVAIMMIGSFLDANWSIPVLGYYSVLYVLSVVVLLRVGLLAYAALWSTELLLAGNLLSTDPDSWYFGNTIALAITVLAVTGYGFVISGAGRALFQSAASD